MYLFILSLLAGFLTVLAPCVLPLIPVIIGSSLDQKNRKGPLIITLSLAISLILFTLVLKASTLFINVDPVFWNAISGGIIIVFGFITLFPKLWDKISLGLKISSKSDQLLQSSSEQHGIWRNILVGMALGPVFSSCSPTYALVLATVLPENFTTGLFYLVTYAGSLSTTLLLISLYGQRLIKNLKWASNPNGIFKKVLGIIFILVGFGIVTGLDKKLQTTILNAGFLDVTKIEFKFLERLNSNETVSNSTGPMLNVKSPVKAPEIINISKWFNSKGESLENLKGKVVLVDFWTYSCINCIRTLPFLKSWDEKYRDKGLVILGIHSPEFAFEHQPENVENAIKEFDIKYPVGMDNDFSTWRAYKNQYWPAKYFIDKNGYLRHVHFGEGAYTDSEEIIRFLLEETGANLDDIQIGLPNANSASYNQQITPETYLGYSRMENFANLNELKKDETNTYFPKATLASNQWTLGGNWEVKSMDTISQADNANLTINFSAKEVYLVMGSPNEVIVKANGQDIKVKDSKLYTVYTGPAFVKNKTLQLTFPKNVTVNAFTFGN